MVVEVFQRQEIANILHTMAKKQHKTCLFPELERRTEVISGEFNCKHAVGVCDDGDKYTYTYT